MPQPFVLVLSASGGTGHLRAGEALKHAADELPEKAACEHHDCLDFTTPWFKRLYGGTYIEMVNRAPELWGYLYELADARSLRKKFLSQVFDHFTYQRYLRALRKFKPDAIVCTHFLPYRSVSESLRRAGISAPVFAATTDCDVHNYWIDPIVDRYYVYHDESAWQLEAKGVSASKIRVLGIPIAPEFEKPLSSRSARRMLGLSADRLTVLIMSGGFGVGTFEDLVHHAAAVLGRPSGIPVTLLVVCGNNRNARKKLEGTRFQKNLDVKIYGFVDNIQELMAASDLLISKAGGLTTAEAMARELPMLIVNPIPGQEMRNADLIVEQRAGWKALNLSHFQYKLLQVLDDPARLVEARHRTRAVAKPAAARKIMADVLNYL